VFCDATQDKITVWLDKVQEYFEIEFGAPDFSTCFRGGSEEPR
jgi:hypothetical protein